ncbi:MAG: DMT family transporter [Gordonia sp. (in: high G+C Gram-positive bacteria)]
MLRAHDSDGRGGIRLGRPEWALIAVTAIWGTSFLVVHAAMEHSGPLFFVGLRFVVAGCFGLMVFGRSLRGLTLGELGAGIAIGATLAFAYSLQTVGLQTISASTSAFITALYVPLVPLMQWAVFRTAPGIMSWIGVTLAFIGLLLVAGRNSGGIGMGMGELVTVLSAAGCAGEIILISYFAGRVDITRVTILQLLAGGALCFLAMPIAGETVPSFSWVWLAAALGMGAASIVIQLTMNWAQRSVSPTRATIIYSGEPVWAGVFGRIAGDRLPLAALGGAALIVLGVLVSEIRPPQRWWPRRSLGADEPSRTADVADQLPR